MPWKRLPSHKIHFMKKVFFVSAGLLSFLIFLGSCHSSQKKEQTHNTDTTLVNMNIKVSDTLAAKVSTFLNAYYQLKDAFVKSDSTAADEAAHNLLQNANTISLAELQSDTARYNKANESLKSLNGEIAGLLGEKTMLGKRREFQMISDITYDLITSTGLKEQKVYRDFCPMFNDGNGAYWLSQIQRINNPYYGDEMLGCGEIKETMQF